MGSVHVPDAVGRQVGRALAPSAGGRATVESARPVGGGCINPSARIQTSDGRTFFLKWNDEHPGLFEPEARGLEALSRPGGPRVPEVVSVGTGEDGAPGWLLLEFVEEGAPGPLFHEELAGGLAAIHEPEAEGQEWGGWEDNFIGPLPQSNRSRSTWSAFWVEERLRPQLRRAREAGRAPGDAGEWEELFARADELLAPAEAEGPSLVHGDLWSGNVYADEDGRPVLIDPAVYLGHREVDLAMTELFGGFGAEFYREYESVRPLAPGYPRARRAVYQLYPLLVHVNLFGGGYGARTASALRSVLAST